MVSNAALLRGLSATLSVFSAVWPGKQRVQTVLTNSHNFQGRCSASQSHPCPPCRPSSPRLRVRWSAAHPRSQRLSLRPPAPGYKRDRPGARR